MLPLPMLPVANLSDMAIKAFCRVAIAYLNTCTVIYA